jgi:hypothetical protein
MSDFTDALMKARQYARHTPNPLAGDDPDDIAEVWNELRDIFDIRSGGNFTCRELDLLADEALNFWRSNR